MRNPVLNILVPYLVFILLFENQIFESSVILKIFILYIISKILICYYTFFRKHKILFLILCEVLIFINLFENNNFQILENFNDIPNREVNLGLEIEKRVSYLDNNYYVAKIKTASPINNYLVNRHILCRFKNNEISDLVDKNFRVKAILSTIFVNNQYLTTLIRCQILNKDKLQKTGIVFQLNLLIEKTLLISAKSESQLTAFLNAILLGNKNMLSGSQKLTFQNSGTLHLFAVSGLHVGFIYLIFKFLISIITHNRFISEIIIAIILLIYLDMVNYPPSASRACLMINIWQLSVVFFKRRNALCSLSFSCLLILIINPYLLMEIGFQLSYTVVSCIIVFNIQAKKFNEKYKFSIKNFLINSLLTSYSAFCGSMLLVYDYFHIIVPVSIIINILAIPIAFIFIISIFLMLSLSLVIEIDFFFFFFSVLYNILDYLLNIIAISDVTYFKIENISDLNNSIHFFYLITILFLANLVYKNSTKVVIQLFFPIFLFLIYMLISV